MKNRLIVASIILICNLIGLVTLFGLYPDDPFCWDGSVLLLLLTFPVTIFGFVFRYAESGYPHIVVVIQLIVSVITLFVGDVIVRYRKRNQLIL